MDSRRLAATPKGRVQTELCWLECILFHALLVFVPLKLNAVSRFGKSVGFDDHRPVLASVDLPTDGNNCRSVTLPCDREAVLSAAIQRRNERCPLFCDVPALVSKKQSHR